MQSSRSWSHAVRFAAETLIVLSSLGAFAQDHKNPNQAAEPKQQAAPQPHTTLHHKGNQPLRLVKQHHQCNTPHHNLGPRAAPRWAQAMHQGPAPPRIRGRPPAIRAIRDSIKALPLVCQPHTRPPYPPPKGVPETQARWRIAHQPYIPAPPPTPQPPQILPLPPAQPAGHPGAPASRPTANAPEPNTVTQTARYPKDRPQPAAQEMAFSAGRPGRPASPAEEWQRATAAQRQNCECMTPVAE
jgi:hypothetical protein